jgi:hypothetical protein
MYPRLANVLAKFDEPDLKIHRAFVLKLGCVALSTFKPVDSSRFPVTETERVLSEEQKTQPPPDEVHSQIIDALQKHPNVFDLNHIDGKGIEFIGGGHYATLQIGRMFSIRINLPHRLQKYAKAFPFGKEAIEEFEVVSSGSLFAAFAPIKDYPVWTNFGQEYRELLVTQMEKETQFKCKRFGPSPIHPNFYFVVRKSADEASGLGMKVYEMKKDLFLVFDDNSQSDLDMAQWFFKLVDFLMFQFYSRQLLRSSLLNYEVEILNRFSDLSKEINDLSATRWWQIPEAERIVRAAKKSLTSIHTRLVGFENELSTFNRQRSSFLRSVKEMEIVSQMHSYLEESLEPHGKLSESLPAALRHFGEELQAFGHKRSVVIAGLIGGATGAFLTAFLSGMF